MSLDLSAAFDTIDHNILLVFHLGLTFIVLLSNGSSLSYHLAAFIATSRQLSMRAASSVLNYSPSASAGSVS